MKFTKRTQIVEAVIFKKGEQPGWVKKEISDGNITPMGDYCIIDTMKGVRKVVDGEYIIKHPTLGLFLCKAKMFEKLYKKV